MGAVLPLRQAVGGGFSVDLQPLCSRFVGRVAAQYYHQLSLPAIHHPENNLIWHTLISALSQSGTQASWLHPKFKAARNYHRAESCSRQERLDEREPTEDIEHVPVLDDPRVWSHARKTLTLVIVSSGSMIAGIATTIQNPANAQIEQDLHTSGSGVSWSVSVFILVQGLVPLLWSALSEIRGRKIVYILSLSLFIIGSAVVATSKSIGLVIGMRALQAAGSSAVLAIAAATLADIYEPHQRGAKMGIYYSAPLLGASVGPFLGGVFAQVFGWRAVFWFALITGGIILVAFLIFFKDTFRKERSLAFQDILRRNLEQRQLPTAARNRVDKLSTDKSQQMSPVETMKGPEAGMTAEPLRVEDITLSFMDIDLFPPIIVILKQCNNNAILLASGLIFGFTYSLVYTCARTLSDWYDYDALYIGLVLLSYGAGSMCGSIFGGRWSDETLAKLKSQHGQEVHAEMRLRSTLPAMLWLPLSAVGYGWVCQTHQPVAAICVMLFIVGLSAAWMYSSTLAYIVDANVGRSSTSVAMNSAYRGTLAFIAAEIAIPLQDSIGDGGLYTFWAGLLVITDILILVVLKFGKKWRES